MIIALLIIALVVICVVAITHSGNAPANSYNPAPDGQQAANEAFTKLFDTGMKNVLVLTQQNQEVERKLREKRSIIFSKTRSSIPNYVSFSGSRSFEDFEKETAKYIMLATSWGVYYGYELNELFSNTPITVVDVIYNAITDAMSGLEDNLYLFATRSGTQKLIRSKLDGVDIFEDDDNYDDFYRDLSDFEDEDSDFDKKTYAIIDRLIDQGYKKANSTLLGMMISAANLYWGQLPEGMYTSRYACFECAVWSVFLCRFMMFSQLHKSREFIDEFSKDITEMLVSATSDEYFFDKSQIDDCVWNRFSAYDKIMMSNRENSQKTDAMLDYIVDIILYESSKQTLVSKLNGIFVPNAVTRMEAYHFATAFYEAVVTEGGELLRSEFATSDYDCIY